MTHSMSQHARAVKRLNRLTRRWPIWSIDRYSRFRAIDIVKGDVRSGRLKITAEVMHIAAQVPSLSQAIIEGACLRLMEVKNEQHDKN